MRSVRHCSSTRDRLACATTGLRMSRPCSAPSVLMLDSIGAAIRRYLAWRLPDLPQSGAVAADLRSNFINNAGYFLVCSLHCSVAYLSLVVCLLGGL